MRLLLISPRILGSGIGKRLLPPLALPVLAAVTPPEVEVSIVDENVEFLNYEIPVDLIGISTHTLTALRAYQIAHEFRFRGKTVILGGPHASALPEEALKYANCVVIGEAESVWPKVIRDFQSHRLQKIYRPEEWMNLDRLPLPKRDLLKRRRYHVFNTIQSSRGCPFNCSFCTVTSFFGGTFRFRSLRQVLVEIETLDGKYIIFVDDNIGADLKRAKELFEALIPYGKNWVGQATTTFAQNRSLVKLAARSGCIGLFIGYESLSPDSLREAGKLINVVGKYREGIRQLHGHGILIHGSFLFGFDHDDPDIFQRTVDFAMDAKLDSASFSILTPYPGTGLYRKLSKEGRIFTQDWSQYGLRPVFRPRGMSVERLAEGTRWAMNTYYSTPSVIRRIFSTRNHPLLRLLVNLGFKTRNCGYLQKTLLWGKRISESYQMG